MNCELLAELNVVFWSNVVKIGQNLTFDPKAAILKLRKNQKYCHRLVSRVKWHIYAKFCINQMNCELLTELKCSFLVKFGPKWSKFDL